MMKGLTLSTLLFLLAFSIVNAAGNPGTFIKTADGVIIYPDPLMTEHVQSVKLEVIADNIIRVLASPKEGSAARRSLIIDYEKRPGNYKKGMFTDIRFDYDDARQTLSIAQREGEYPGMLSRRVFIIKYITKGKPQKLEFESNAGIVVAYDGSRRVVQY